MNARTKRFPLFDSLRGLALLMVFGYHALGSAAVNPGADLGPFISNLSVGLSVFFVISGFLLYRPFVLTRVENLPRLDVKAYGIRRVLRIVPAYWVALVVVALWLGTPGILTLEGIPHYFLFGQVYSSETALGGIPQAWSLDVEVIFYAFLPLLAFCMRRLPGADRARQLRQEWIVLAGLVAISLAFNAFVLAVGGPASRGTALHSFPSFLDALALGMMLAVGSVAWGDNLPAALRPLDRLPSLAWGIALVLFVIAGLSFYDEGGSVPLTGSEFLSRRVVFALIAVCVVAPAVFGRTEQGLVRRLLANGWLLWLGMISYSAFLYHVAVIQQLERWDLQVFGTIHPYLFAIDALIPALAVSAVAYYLVERPGLRLKRYFEPRRRPPPEGPAPAPALSGTTAGR